ncbi:MAG: hypothetical protein HYS70_02895 [Nitrospinae bacterium]|nr:hypothetical protein [Nitrospinota bacterium]
MAVVEGKRKPGLDLPFGRYAELGIICKEQLKVAEKLGVAGMGLPISSDPIESLFGVAKSDMG